MSQPTPEFVQQFLTALKEQSEIDFPFNKTDDPPFALVHPVQHDLAWVCGYDEDGTLLSILRRVDETTKKEKRYVDIVTVKKAKYMQQEFVKEGWVKMKAPKINFEI